MAEILSQSQIDSLLSSLIGEASQLGETEKPEETVDKESKKKIKEYDFRSPKLFTREQLKLLFSIYENYARIVSSQITGVLQSYSLVEIIEVEEQQYYEFNNALPDSVLIGMVDFAFKDGEGDEDFIIVEMSKDIGFSSIDRLLGGPGKPVTEDREYTEIEIGILEYFMKGMVNLMKNVWFDYIEVYPKLMKIETNSRILQGISADENVVIVVMSILVNETQGKLNICIPGRTLDLLFKKKTNQSKKVMRKGDLTTETQRRASIISEINKTELEITGVLGRIDIVSQELVELEVGDIIKLNKPESSPVELIIENETWFTGEIGVSNKKKAIQIRENFKKGSEYV